MQRRGPGAAFGTSRNLFAFSPRAHFSVARASVGMLPAVAASTFPHPDSSTDHNVSFYFQPTSHASPYQGIVELRTLRRFCSIASHPSPSPTGTLHVAPALISSTHSSRRRFRI
ncbi:hypothetical protein BCR44DRAFT_1191704 [Catenaria anguillulae PL171]|uniref:Uncharacterized protein n=1 Tax=Catenaria anguillulae PL171 TaxID=765915 RepID=A0A1Y2HH23_9FUNG|nr:hypothetical protein BCR44DRAFT_1191704 [Catenaria anguillulae PL171]